MTATTFKLTAAAAAVLCALAASRLVVPLPGRELPREPFLRGVFGGVGNYLRDRVLLVALVVISLVYYLTILTFDAGLALVQLLELGLTFSIAAACVHIDVVVCKEIWRVGHLQKHPDCPHWPPKG